LGDQVSEFEWKSGSFELNCGFSQGSGFCLLVHFCVFGSRMAAFGGVIHALIKILWQRGSNWCKPV